MWRRRWCCCSRSLSTPCFFLPNLWLLMCVLFCCIMQGGMVDRAMSLAQQFSADGQSSQTGTAARDQRLVGKRRGKAQRAAGLVALVFEGLARRCVQLQLEPDDTEQAPGDEEPRHWRTGGQYTGVPQQVRGVRASARVETGTGVPDMWL